MRCRWIGLAALAALLAGMASGALAAAGPRATGGGQAAAGGPGAPNMATFGFNARPSTGTVSLNVRRTDTRKLAQHFVGDVDCYRQEGAEAWMSGDVQRLRLGSNTNTGRYFLLRVRDGGEPEADLIGWRRATSPIDCKAKTVRFAANVRKGNVQVAQPTS